MSELRRGCIGFVVFWACFMVVMDPHKISHPVETLVAFAILGFAVTVSLFGHRAKATGAQS